MPGRTNSTPKLAADARKSSLELQRVFVLQALKVASSFINSSTLARRVRDLQDEHAELESYRQVRISAQSIECILFHAFLQHAHGWGKSEG